MDSWMVLTPFNQSDETGSGKTGSEIYLSIFCYLMKKTTKDTGSDKTGSEIYFFYLMKKLPRRRPEFSSGSVGLELGSQASHSFLFFGKLENVTDVLLVFRHRPFPQRRFCVE